MQAEPIEREWWRNAFDLQYVKQVEVSAANAEQTDAEVSSLVNTFTLTPDMRVLDMGCGQGRHVIAFAERGFESVGIDISPLLLDIARRRGAESQASCYSFVEGDFSLLQFSESFDVALNLFTAFGYFEEDRDNQRTVATAYASLRKGGLFMCETLNRDEYAHRLPQRKWRTMADGTILLLHNDLNQVTGRLETTYEYLMLDHSRFKQRMSVRFYTATEIVNMFKAAGFHSVTVHEGFLDSLTADSTFGELSTKSGRLLVCGRK